MSAGFPDQQCEITWGLPGKWSVILPVYYRSWGNAFCIVIRTRDKRPSSPCSTAINSRSFSLLHTIKSSSRAYQAAPVAQAPGAWSRSVIYQCGAEVNHLNFWVKDMNRKTVHLFITRRCHFI